MMAMRTCEVGVVWRLGGLGGFADFVDVLMQTVR